jgi:hypothetical protein
MRQPDANEKGGFSHRVLSRPTDGALEQSVRS